MNRYYIKRGYENTLDKFFEFFHGIILLDTYIRNDILQSIKCTFY